MLLALDASGDDADREFASTLASLTWLRGLLDCATLRVVVHAGVVVVDRAGKRHAKARRNEKKKREEECAFGRERKQKKRKKKEGKWSSREESFFFPSPIFYSFQKNTHTKK